VAISIRCTLNAKRCLFLFAVFAKTSIITNQSSGGRQPGKINARYESTSRKREISKVYPDFLRFPKERITKMTKKTSPPSIKKTAFDCPHCGAFTTQYWFSLYAKGVDDDKPLPRIPDEDFKERFEKELVKGEKEIPAKTKEYWFGWYDKMATGLVFLDEKPDSAYSNFAHNLYISKCYNCKKISVWVHDNIIFPPEKQGVQPNQDLPDEIIKDFEEARSIVGLSPRGAAALLRLCIQKLCAFLGEKGKNIDADIASLVSKGLNPLVQKSLDIVRVIGGQAVHPGVIDLNDNRDIADRLFGLINSIADQMISHPKNVQELYGKLPEGKRKAIEDRNGKAG